MSKTESTLAADYAAWQVLTETLCVLYQGHGWYLARRTTRRGEFFAAFFHRAWKNEVESPPLSPNAELAVAVATRPGCDSDDVSLFACGATPKSIGVVARWGTLEKAKHHLHSWLGIDFNPEWIGRAAAS